MNFGTLYADSCAAQLQRCSSSLSSTASPRGTTAAATTVPLVPVLGADDVRLEHTVAIRQREFDFGGRDVGAAAGLDQVAQPPVNLIQPSSYSTPQSPVR